MPPKQQQKQKQTVIVNIGDKIVKRKRKRKAKPRRKAPSSVESIAYQEAIQGELPLFIRTQMPTASNVQTDKVLFQLADVTKQLNQLQERQRHATGNLMAGQRAAEREEQQAEQPLSTVPELGAPRGRRKQRSDIGVPRGPSMRTASREAALHGARLQSVMNPVEVAPSQMTGTNF